VGQNHPSQQTEACEIKIPVPCYYAELHKENVNIIRKLQALTNLCQIIKMTAYVL
jgi:hypothetical protein